MDGPEQTHDRWKDTLSPLAYEVTRCQGTERPFSGEYYENHRTGTYRCVCCGEPLFHSQQKYDSGSGWPSFWQPSHPENLETQEDGTHGMVRTEVHCKSCGAHMGHVFPDGPEPTGLRYCINSVSLTFEEEATD